MSIIITHTENLNSSSGYTTTLVKDNIKIECPSERDNDSALNETKSKDKILNIYHENHGSVKAQINVARVVNEDSAHDITYMDGSVSRNDYAVGTTQGQAIVAKLQATWPEEIPSYTTHGKNLVAEYTAQRPPYTNDSISFYNFEEPSDAIKTTFNASYEQYMSWHGLKFDKVTEDVLAKFVIPAEEMERVDPDTYIEVLNGLPLGSYHFYARIHDKSDNINENIDVYFLSDANIVKDWCTENSYTFPYDISDSSIEPKLMIWGCVYNITSNTFTHIKAYTRQEA